MTENILHKEISNTHWKHIEDKGILPLLKKEDRIMWKEQ